jgi:hypothetical protein
MTEYKTPHVHEAIAAILESLSVAKGGTLPGNMGGKPYITAVDAAAEVKRKFVENDLIFLPNESIFKHESIINKDRINVLISITGEYTFISTRDGSSVKVSGTGDGLAGGTAVASNIASTNALKNALLRTFLITEQSVEDAAKGGDESPAAKPSATQQKIEQARRPAAATSDAQAKIRDWIGTDESRRTTVNTTMDKLKKTGLTKDALFEAIAKEVGA